MLAFIKGIVLHQGIGYLLLECGGIGYKITLPETIVCHAQDQATFFLHEVVRENERELFGFTSIGQLELFWKLLNVSGVGPRSGQKIVFSDETDHIKAKIMAGDVVSLTHIPGIGKKTAQKIILELKGVLAEEPLMNIGDLDAVEALVGLGYSRRDAQDALFELEETDTENRIRAALKRLSRSS
ncbi:MAG: Holliday junction ATP-dependent DNA helicase RuvA [Candidatus Uhrbacteria bacterium GW2011_GWF2_39_13]|uniref:Holliday junction branch migration complex subunit RuvA n=1 Tax=Candidatus Uhrbacteria bacterium GW2011_GWF2_39_13 TaxID=1618995 RepID=A0A0G0QQK9_9BACT|nr:MAG: Holliday junction ATP-dependent DNA helicase RuvA [Candidatus Uhrbacteria bacterium GW2011_GWF2_39_13]HAU66477.1 Holliday junction branch migration protein RuvA [Candidatus Uhrbacteria bacterium]